MKTVSVKFILSLIIILSGWGATAQQIPDNNFKVHNPFVFNPAATGLYGNVTAFFDYRDSWTGFKDAPEYFVFGIHGLITNSMGLGIIGSSLKSGIFRKFSVNLNYSYRIAFADKNSLAMGISAGIAQNKIDESGVIMSDPNDPALNSNNFNESLFNIGFGVNYVLNDFTVNISSPLFYSSQEDKFVQTAFALFSYDFYFTDDIWRLQPSILYTYTNKDIHQGELTVVADWNRNVWVQAGYNTNKSIITGVGLTIKKLSLGYSYQISLSEIYDASYSSHNIMLQYALPYSVTKKTPLYRRTRRRNVW